MVSGEVTQTPVTAAEGLPVGTVVTSSGRISGVHRVGEEFDDLPFTTQELVTLDDALTDATRETKVRFNVYVGDLGEADPAAATNALFPTTPEAERSVLIAVSPNQRTVQIRGGRAVANRVTDRIAQLGVTAAVASFSEGDLIDGLVSAIRVMSAAIAAP